MSRYFPHVLASVYFFFFIALAISPVSREVWVAEIIPVLLIFMLLVFTYRKFRHSLCLFLLRF